MNASAAVRGLSWIPRAGPAFREGDNGEEFAQPSGWHARLESVRNILSLGGYTVTQLSDATRRRYGNKSPYFIPPTFLYKLKSGVTPHICQVVALSECTGYRFIDCLRMCGFDLRQVPRLQMRLHVERTVLLTPIEGCLQSFPPPLSLAYEEGWRSPACSNPEAGEWGGSGRYRFAKIGTADALLHPRLLPGSIVRVDRCYANRNRGVGRACPSDLLWLVEQPDGLTCCQVRWIDDRQIVLLPGRPPWGFWPLHVPTEARILGVVDLDLSPPRPVMLPARAGPIDLERLAPPPHRTETETMSLSHLLRTSRRRTGLTFRAAHRLTRAIAQILGSREYAIALGLLSDYEAMGRLPRHIAKILSLCVLYCMDIRELMEAAGVHIDDSAKLALPIADGGFLASADFLDNAAPYSGLVGYAQSAGR